MKKLLLIVVLLFTSYLFGQSPQYFSSGDFSSPYNWAQDHAAVMSSSFGGSFIHTTTSNGTDNRYFRFYSAVSGGTKYEPNGSLDIEISLETGTALQVAGSSEKAYYINAANTTDNYVFKTIGSGTPGTSKLILFKINGNIQTVSDVSIPINLTPYADQTITATISSAFAGGQGVYIRYTNTDFANSVVAKMTGTGTTYTADIPAEYNIPGVQVKYYVFTSGDDLIIPSSEADFYTINLNNSNGNNYSYTPTSNINWCNLEYPDSSNNAIVMGQDYTMKSQVYVNGVTNNTSNAGNFTCWYGYSISNSHPDTWTNWVQVTSSPTVVGNNFQYELSTRNLLPSVSSGTFYIATRYQYNNGNYVYGGWNNDNGNGGKGGFWGRYYNNTLSVSGKFNVQEIAINGDALNNTNWDVYSPMYSSDGKNFSTTIYLYADNGLKFVQNRDYTNNNDWGYSGGSDTFHHGTATLNGGNNFTVPNGGSGNYLVTFNIETKVYAFAKTDCTSTDGETTWNGSTGWNNGNPSLTKKAIINADYNTTTDGSISSCECQINSGNTVTVGDNTYFTVAKKITNEGTITVKNTGNVIQYNNDTNDGSGTYQVEKTTSAASQYDYIYWGSPLSNAQINSVFSENPLNYIYEFVTSNFIDLKSGPYIQVDNGSDGYDDNRDDWSLYNNGTMTPGKGYIVMVKGSQIPFNSANLGSSVDPQNVVFTGGKFNNGDISFTTSQDGTNDYDTYNNNLNFISNPYPSAISADRFITANSSIIDGPLYFWTHKTAIAANNGPNAYDFTNADYATYSTAGGVASANGGAIPTGNIASCQGFMVPVKEEVSGNIVFNNNMRLAVNNNNFYRQSQALTAEKNRIWLKLSHNEGLYRQILLAFLPEATLGADQAFDAARLPDATTDDFYSLIASERYAIQALPTFESTFEIPLGMQLKTDHNYQIAIQQSEGIFTEGQTVYLEDTYQNVIHNLSESPYSFTSPAGNNINDRFILRFTNATAGNEELELQNVKVYPNPSHSVFNISYQGNEMPRVTVFDLNGKVLFQSESTNKIDLSNFSNGLYFAKMQFEKGQKTVKLVKE